MALGPGQTLKKEGLPHTQSVWAATPGARRASSVPSSEGLGHSEKKFQAYRGGHSGLLIMMIVSHAGDSQIWGFLGTSGKADFGFGSGLNSNKS